MRRPPTWVCWAAVAWFLAETIVAVLLADWYVQLLIDQAHRL